MRGALAATISVEIAHALGSVLVEMVVGKQSLGGADSWFSRYGAYAVLTAASCSWSPSTPSLMSGSRGWASGASSSPPPLLWRPPASSLRLSRRARSAYTALLLVLFGLIIAGVVVAAALRHPR